MNMQAGHKPPITRAGPQPALKRLQARHHLLARYIAAGLRPAAVAALTGYSPSYISTLKRDPSFSELVEHYREVEEAQHLDLGRMMADLGIEALEVLRDRLRGAPEEFSPKDLMELLRTLADRTGHGPTRKEERTVAFKGLAERMAEVIDAEVLDAGSDHGRTE